MNIVLIGSGGLAREIQTYFSPEHHIRTIEIYYKDGKILGDLPGHDEFVYLAIGNPFVKRAIHNFLREHPDLKMQYGPGLFHHRAYAGQKVHIDSGSIITPGVVLTTNVIIEPHVLININSTVGHDCRIGAFSVVNPGVNISGEVTLGDTSLVGTNATILEKHSIASRTTIGASATITKDIAESNGVYIGTPARRKE